MQSGTGNPQTTDFTDAEFIRQCEITTECNIAIGPDSRLRLYRLAGYAGEPPNRMIEWPSVWEMIDDAKKRVQNA